MPWRANDLDNVLAAIAKKYEAEFEPLGLDSATFEALDIKNMASRLDQLIQSKAIRDPLRDLPLWAKLWPGSLVLGRFLRKFAPEGKSLLELGCGMGGLSLAASQYGFARILATDIDTDALLFARANVLRNRLEGVIAVERRDVRSPREGEEKFDMIAASELLYLDELHRPLLRYLDRHLAPGGKAFFCSDLARPKPRFQKLAAKDFAVQEGKIRLSGSENRIYSILILERKNGNSARNS